VRAVAGTWLLAIAFLAPGCGDGGGGGPLRIQEVRAVGAGSLPETDLYLNGEIRVRFSRAVDPSTVSEETFRVTGGPDFEDPVAGSVVVRGREVAFVPRLPSLPDLSDSGFAPGALYRLHVQGERPHDPGAPVIRTPGGRPLEEGRLVELAIRDFEPFFFDERPRPLEVRAVGIDLDGDGVVEADGLARTPQEEEFPGRSFREDDPVATGVRTGSLRLPPPDGPLRLAFFLSEPLDPRAFATPGSGAVAAVFERERLVPCPEPPGGSCSRPVPVTLELRNEFVADEDRFRTAVLVTVERPLKAREPHGAELCCGVRDLFGETLENCLRFAFDTGGPPAGEDRALETFADRSRRDAATTAHWSALGIERLRAGVGFGGDGSDGEPEIAGNTLVLDTTGNDGIWSFVRFDTQNILNFTLTIQGDKPAVIRALERVFLESRDAIVLAGENGRDGVPGRTDRNPGGRGGPGGFDGGDASPQGSETVRGETWGAPAGTQGGGEGGASGNGPGGGGGAGHATGGSDGDPGDDGEGSQGRGGLPYGGPATLAGGSGGGAGGNHDPPAPGAGSSGGSGGGGGGALLIETAGDFILRPSSRIDASGGNGGRGALPGSGLHSAGGGGGSGGTLIVRARRLLGILGEVDARGGTGGSALAPAGKGGSGADGFIRLEQVAAPPSPCGPPRCSPPASTGILDPAIVGHSVGRSRYFSTNLREGEPRYAFDGADPATGEVRLGPEVQDVRVVDASGEPLDALPEGVSIVIVWSGALEDPERPHQPDPTTIRPWLTDITELDGLPLIRYEVRFDVPDELVEDELPGFPGVDDLRFRIRR